MEDARMTIKQVADELEITPHGVYRLIERGRMTAVKVSARQTYILRSELDAYKRTFSSPRTNRVSTLMPERLTNFVLATGMRPDEFLEAWKIRSVEETPESIRLAGQARMISRWLKSKEAESARVSAVAFFATSSPGR